MRPGFLVDFRPPAIDHVLQHWVIPPTNPPSTLLPPVGPPAMFDLTIGKTSDCRGLSRRQFLRVGGLSALGLSLPAYLRATSQAAKATRCILLWMQGGPSHHETFDPKPDAPAEIRGEFGTVPTTLPGVRIAEHLPLLARQTDKYS